MPGKSSGTSFVSIVCLVGYKYIFSVLTSLDSTDGPGTCPERRNQSLNSRVRKIVEERRKSCPWYFWGLEGYTRERFPEGWLCFYENGDVGDASQDNQLLYPWDNLHASNAGSPAAAKGADKTELWDLPLSEMEKSVKSIKLQIAESRAMLDEKKAKASKIRTEASATVNTREREAIASLHKIQTEADAQVRKIKRVASAKCNKIRTEADALHIKIQTEADAKFNESQADISELEETMKEKQSLLEVQEITLAARRANDSYVN